MTPSPVILKFGSSVLRNPADLPRVATEIYRYYRKAAPIIAVISAYDGATDRLIADARDLGLEEGSEAYIRLVSTGEYDSADGLLERLKEIGIGAELLTPRDMNLTAVGERTRAAPVAVDTGELFKAFRRNNVIIVPGYSAVGRDGETVLMGRGGSDMTAIFLAAALRAGSARLIKDVNGLYEADPNLEPGAKRFARIAWADAVNIGGVLIQPEAVAFAAGCGVEIEVAGIGQMGATRIGPISGPPEPAPKRRALRVALAGCGTVGGGVLQRLMPEPRRYEVTSVLVRDADKHSEFHPLIPFTTRRAAMLDGKPDVLIEALPGGAGAELIFSALKSGVSVVTASKQAVAENLSCLTALAAAQKTDFKYSACVGGAAPILETIKVLGGNRPISKVEAILNGTVNYIGSRLADGDDFEGALSAARAAGFAEADPQSDLSGADALAKAKIIAAVAFPGHGEPITLGVEAMAGGPVGEDLIKSGRLNQVVSIAPSPGGGIGVRVEMVAAGFSKDLLQLSEEFCGALITFKDGDKHFVSARGAGRVPTVESLLGDLGEIERRLIAIGALNKSIVSLFGSALAHEDKER